MLVVVFDFPDVYVCRSCLLLVLFSSAKYCCRVSLSLVVVSSWLSDVGCRVLDVGCLASLSLVVVSLVVGCRLGCRLLVVDCLDVAVVVCC
jgi:hypothetical protein